jgi:hypothetical protein
MHIFSSNILCTQVKLRKVIIKMHTKSSKIKVASKNLHVLCVVKLILGLLYILSELDYVHSPIKIAQSWNVFVCDFVEHQVGPTRIISILVWSFHQVWRFNFWQFQFSWSFNQWKPSLELIFKSKWQRGYIVYLAFSFVDHKYLIC